VRRCDAENVASLTRVPGAPLVAAKQQIPLMASVKSQKALQNVSRNDYLEKNSFSFTSPNTKQEPTGVLCGDTSSEIASDKKRDFYKK
jgi:hypothetical protein